MAAKSPSVVLVSDQFPPAKGGIGDYVTLLADALVDRGVRASLFVRRDSNPSACRAPITATFDRWSWGAARELYRALVATNADWVHLQHNGGMYDSCRLAAYFLPRYLRWKRWNGKIAVTFHDINRPLLFYGAGRVRDWVVGDLATNANLVIAADDTDINTLRSFGADAIQVPIGSNIPTYRQDRETVASVRRRYAIPSDHVLLGHFGTAIGLDTLFRALPLLPNTTLLLIGKTDALGSSTAIDRVPQALHSLLNSTQCSPRVRWTCHLSASDVTAALSACDVIALPYPAGASLRHGGLIAALCQGRAIVTTTPQNSLGPLVAGQTLITVPPNDAQALAGAVQEITANKEKKAGLEAAARNTAEYFSWRNIADSHLNHYLAACGRFAR